MYSHIRVLERGSERALYFVGDADIDVVETVIDLRHPERLQHAYARSAMLGLLYPPKLDAALLVGLGGGAIVQFLNHHFPALALDVVEIDAAVVRVARDWFGLRAAPGTTIHVADGRAFLAERSATYDLILVDAHLHPDPRTDGTGHPLSLKSAGFYASVKARLAPGGVVMFNMIAGRDADAYLASIARAFGTVDVYRPTDTGNLIVFATARGTLPTEQALRDRAGALDRRGGFGFSFAALLATRARRGNG